MPFPKLSRVVLVSVNAHSLTPLHFLLTAKSIQTRLGPKEVILICNTADRHLSFKFWAAGSGVWHWDHHFSRWVGSLVGF